MTEFGLEGEHLVAETWEDWMTAVNDQSFAAIEQWTQDAWREQVLHESICQHQGRCMGPIGVKVREELRNREALEAVVINFIRRCALKTLRSITPEELEEVRDAARKFYEVDSQGTEGDKDNPAEP